MPKPPDDGHPLGVALKARQHRVQVVAGPESLSRCSVDRRRSTCAASGGWTCGFSLSFDDGQSWNIHHYSTSISTTAVTGNPTIAIDSRGVVFAVAMCAEEGNHGRGILQLCTTSGCRSDLGRPWRTILAPNTTAFPIGLGVVVTKNRDLHLHLLQCRENWPQTQGAQEHD